MKNHLNRRALLQGLGTVSIGLPLLEEMITANALGAAKAKVPVRAFNVFFGLGIPAPLQNEGFDDVLEPLQPLSKKLLIMRNVDHVRCDVRGINAHFDGATASFTACARRRRGQGGRAVHRSGDPPRASSEGLPSGMVPTLVAGTFSGAAASDVIITVTHSTAPWPRACRKSRATSSTACSVH